MFFFIRAYQVYTSSAEIQPHLLVVHSDMGRSVVSISRVVEYPCLASPGSSRTDYAMPNHSSVSAGIQAQTSRRSDWRAQEPGMTAAALENPEQFCRGWVYSRVCWASACTAFGFLCVYCAASSGFALYEASSNTTLVL